MKNDALCSEHGNIQTEQLNTALYSEHDNTHSQEIILKQKVMNNKPPYTEHEVYAQQKAGKQKAQNTTPCTEHKAIYTQQNILKQKGRNVAPRPQHENIPSQLKLRQKVMSSTMLCQDHDSNIPIQQNICYELSDDETAIDPPVYDEVDVQPTSAVYTVADADSHAGTSEGEEEDEYYVNDSLPSYSNVKKGSSQEDCKIAVEENGAYNATITHSLSPIYDDGIYY